MLLRTQLRSTFLRVHINLMKLLRLFILLRFRLWVKTVTHVYVDCQVLFGGVVLRAVAIFALIEDVPSLSLFEDVVAEGAPVDHPDTEEGDKLREEIVGGHQ